MKTFSSVFAFSRLIALAISVFAVLPAWSARYYLKNSSSYNDYEIWDEKDSETGLYKNWSTESAAGQNSENLPGESDDVININVAYDLNGGDWTVGTFGAGAAWEGFGVRNGTLTVLKEYYGQYGDHRWSNVHLVIPKDSMARTGASDANPTVWILSNGSVFDILGTMSSFHTRVRIDETSTLNFKPTSYLTDGGKDRYDEWKNKGTFNLPNGMKMDSGSLECKIIQEGGALNLGGDIISNGHEFSFLWTAGTVNVLSDAVLDGVSTTIGNDSKESPVILNVSENVSFSIPLVEFKQKVSLAKGGLGTAFLTNVPDILILNEGSYLTTAFEIPSVNFAGGSLSLEASSTAGMPFIKEVSCAEGAKALIFVDKLYLLNPGTYTLVASGNTLSASDYEITLDPAVNATWSVAEDGSVEVTIKGLNENVTAHIWNPAEGNNVWDLSSAAWTFGESTVAFKDGSVVLFNGTEANYSQKIEVVDFVSPSVLKIDGAKDYTFTGGVIDTLYINKSGSGVFTFDNQDLTTRDFTLGGGELAFTSALNNYLKSGIKVEVADNADVKLSLKANDVEGLFDFKYKSGSTNWETTDDYEVTLTPMAIADFISKDKPSAPDAVSLSGKSVYVSGYFFVSNTEAEVWSFKGRYDDGIILKIDSNQIFKTSDWQNEQTKEITLDEGWHKFEIRAYDGSGGWGYSGGSIRAKSPLENEYKNFHEENYNMDWRGSSVDPSVPPANVELDLVVGDSSNVKIASAGYVLKTLDLGEGATISIDPQTVPANKPFIVIEDAELRSSVKEMLQSQLGTIGTIMEIDNSLAWKMKAVFNNAEITDFENKDGWVIGIVPGTDEDITIAGEGVAPIINENTRSFKSITVDDGATLAVSAEREIANITLNAGTSLKVNNSLGSIKVTATGSFVTVGDGTITVDVAEGCVFDLSQAEVSCEAILVKRGLGAIVFGPTLPQKLKIEEGKIALQPSVSYNLASIDIGDAAEVAVWLNNAVRVACPIDGESGAKIYYARGTCIKSGSWSDEQTWVSGIKPEAQDIAWLMIPDTELTIDTTDDEMPTRIVVGDDAILKIFANVELPPVELAPTASLIVGDNEEKTEVTATLNAELVTTVDDKVTPVRFPVVEVSTNATFAVNPSNKLKNTNLRIFGTFKPTTGEDFTFGWADVDEETYFALYVDGGKIKVNNVKKFACSEVNGTVIVTSPILIRNSIIDGYWSSRTEIGAKNSTNHPFDFILDNTRLFTGVYDSIVGGAARLVVTNNAVVENDFNSSRNIYLKTESNGQIVVADGGFIKFVPSDGCVSIRNSDDTVPGLVLAGGRFQSWRQTSNAKSTMAVTKDSTWELYAATCIPYGTSVFSNNPFSDFKWVNIEEGATLKFKFIDKLSYFGAGDQNFVLADTPIMGGGSILVENERKEDDAFTLTVCNGENAATGTISACDRSKLLFADGANWAGTVVAGNVALTNLTAEVERATVNFGSLDLTAHFPIRTWRTEGGDLVADSINVGTYLNNGGKLMPIMQTEGASFNLGDKIYLGTINKTSQLPKVAMGWEVVVAQNATDENLNDVTLKRRTGLRVILR